MALALLVAAGCAHRPSAAPTAPVATAWPAADRLFDDPRWLGGDGAYTVDLGEGRILWLFGDSFVATAPGQTRAQAEFVRSSVGVQHGPDPTRARMRFHWRRSGGRPAAFFAAAEDRWSWPLHGIRLGGAVTLFLLEVAPGPPPLGFRTVGWRAVRVNDPRGPPDEWKTEPLPVAAPPFPAVVGSSVLAHGDHVYAYAVQEPGDHDVYVARWSRDDFRQGRLHAVRWHDGAAGWVPQAELRGPPAPVFEDGQVELSVVPDRERGRFVAIQTRGFGASPISLRTAPAPEGPWSPLEDVYRPEEAQRPGVYVYAAKAHPSVAAGRWTALTYATNAWDPAAVRKDPTLYRPRFVRLDLGRVH